MEINGEGSNLSPKSIWTWEQDKAFERGLVIYPDGSLNRWENIAAQIPGKKTIEDIKHHYQLLVEDIDLIVSGKVALPNYTTLPPKHKESKSEPEIRKGQPWTEEEHKQFLLGMTKYGKGDWKSISNDFVKTRTPSQVASHAQKHFKRQMKKKKDVKRWSIFDITSPSDQEDFNNFFTLRENQSTSTIIDEVKIKERVAKEDQEYHQVFEDLDPLFEDLDPLLPYESRCHDDEFDLEMELELEDCLSVLPPL